MKIGDKVKIQTKDIGFSKYNGMTGEIIDYQPTHALPYWIRFEFQPNKYKTLSVYESELILLDGTIDDNQSCQHTWKKYIGFTEVYDFCTKCQDKKYVY